MCYSVLSKGGEFKTWFFLVEKLTKPVLWLLAKQKTDPQDSFPKPGISTLMGGERRSPQMDTCSNSSSSSRHNLKTFIWNKPCQSVFLNDKTGKTIFSSEEDLPLVSKIPVRPLNISIKICLCHREITEFSSWKGITYLLSKRSQEGKHVELGYSNVFSLWTFFTLQLNINGIFFHTSKVPIAPR